MDTKPPSRADAELDLLLDCVRAMGDVPCIDNASAVRQQAETIGKQLQTPAGALGLGLSIVRRLRRITKTG